MYRVEILQQNGTKETLFFKEKNYCVEAIKKAIKEDKTFTIQITETTIKPNDIFIEALEAL